ncbi:MAG: GGDEF domain-containing protein [Gemmatimonadetes bacterium]|nr:GGDEF domain-containing protein [Gemmatimonadota bacterium]
MLVRGRDMKWLWRAAFVAGVALAFTRDTQHEPLAPLTLVTGPLLAAGYLAAGLLLVTLPPSRRSIGTRTASMTLIALGLLAASLAIFYLLQRLAPDITSNPWLVRWARYGFYTEVLLNFVLAWAMVRLMLEDGRRESDDTRAHLKLVHDREKLAELYDPVLRLLGRRAFDAQVGLDFARASFGSVARLHFANYQRILDTHGSGAASAVLAHVAGVVDSAVRPHDRVYRWSDTDLLVIMPRAVPEVARARVEFIAGRAAPLSVAGVKESLRAETAVTVAAFTGGEDLAQAAASVAA